MKKIILSLLAALIFATGFVACNEWTTTEANDYYKPWKEQNRPESYYKALKAYKASDHSVLFGWYGNWTGTGASQANCLMGLPDSVDFVSMWGNWHSLSPEKMADKKRVKELKGTRVMICFIVDNIGAQVTPPPHNSSLDATLKYWGWGSTPESVDEAIRKYARAIIDTITKYDFDGFDLDLEPGFGHSGNIASNSKNLGTFVDEMSKHIGPNSGTGRLFAVDGEPYEVPATHAKKIDYYILQAYSSPNDGDLNGRLSTLVSAFSGEMTKEEITRRTIVCETFEAFAANGGIPFTTKDGRIVPSLIGMAQWEPNTGARKGGIGAYHMEYDYPANPEYKYIRQAIGIMNPSAK